MGMAIRLVALDLDDTLLDSRLEISRECQEAIAEVSRRGVKVTLATGRMFKSALRYAKQLNMNLPLITYQGAWVKNSGSGETIYYRPVPPEHGLAFLERIRTLGCHYQTYLDDELYLEELTPQGMAYARMAGVEPRVVESLEPVVEQGPLKILIIEEDTTLLDRWEKELKEEFGHSLYITRSKPHYLEAMHPEATKGQALAALAAYYGIERQEVMAVGDSYNDLDMIRWAGLGVAVANAHRPVQQAADYVTLSNDEHGVAEALRRFVLQREGNGIGVEGLLHRPAGNREQEPA